MPYPQIDYTGKYTNLSVQVGAIKGMGYGESLGAFIYNEGMEIPSAERLKQDIIDGLNDKGEPPKSSPDYYLRFFKSFYRMGGTIRYVSVDNSVLLHNIYAKLKELTEE